MIVLSIVIPVFNRAHLICATLNSVIPQCGSDCEIIVIDDGSVDGTSKVLETYKNQIQTLRTTNQGAGLARNAGIQMSRGEYIAFLDSDDLWFPWAVNNLKLLIDRCGRPSVLQTTSISMMSGQSLPDIAWTEMQYQSHDDVWSYGLRCNMRGAGATVAKAECLRRCGGFSNRPIVGEDIDLLFKLGTEKGCVLLTYPPSFAYCRHEGMTTLSADAWYKGAMFLLHQESRGIYPGGRLRQRERQHCLAMDAAYRSLVCLKAGNVKHCLCILLSSLSLQIQAGNYNYLFKTPIRILLAACGLWPSAIIRQKRLNER